MEKRTFLAFALCIAVFLIWTKFVVEPNAARPYDADKEIILRADNGTADTSQSEEAVASPSDDSTETVEGQLFEETSVEEIETSIETDNYVVILTNNGARIKELFLKKYLDKESNKGQRLLYDVQDGVKAWNLLDQDGKPISGQKCWKVFEYEDGKSVRFEFTSKWGVIYEKLFRFYDDKYLFEMEITVRNASAERVIQNLRLTGPAGIFPEISDSIPLTLAGVGKNDKGQWKVVKEIQQKDLKKNPDKYTHNDTPAYKWFALSNKYFSCAIIPAQSDTDISTFKLFSLKDNGRLDAELVKNGTAKGDSAQLAKLEDKFNDNAGFELFFKPFDLKQAEERSFKFAAFVGPKDTEVISSGLYTAYGLDVLVDYGLFGFISHFLLKILNVLYYLLGNYGVAIIILTLIVKLILFPLTLKQQVSMFKMQNLAPKMTALRERYKNNAKKMQMEMMKFYKEEGVNPIGGCLPILVQIPIFIGLYQGIRYSIDLRMAPFMLWIQDLSVPDVFAVMPFSFLGTSEIHLLAILMAGLWILQSAIQPKSPDPKTRQQQKIFMFMPLLFLFFLYNAPAGLLLYFVVNSLFGVIETQLIKKVFIPENPKLRIGN